MTFRSAPVIAWICALSMSQGQQPESFPCFRFNGNFFGRISWATERGWSADTSSVLQLTQLPHPRGTIVRAPNERVARAPFPPADSIWYRSAVTSWYAPAGDTIVINWFTGVRNFVFTLGVRGDTLAGKVQDHGDRIDPGIRAYPVRAVRIPCPTFPASNERLEPTALRLLRKPLG